VSVAHAGNTVRLAVRVPAAGTVNALAKARVARKSRRTGPIRTVANARGKIDRAGKVTLVLRPSGRYLAMLRRKKRLTARVEIRFAPKAGGRTLKSSRTVAFTLSHSG
jgi:hypothetical protein